MANSTIIKTVLQNAMFITMYCAQLYYLNKAHFKSISTVTYYHL